MINIVVPMAGLGSRFAKAGYTTAKPFIPVNGKPMVARVLENLSLPDCKYVLITREELKETHQKELKELGDQYPIELVTVKELTEGAACTVLHARKNIQSDIPMVIANSDQLIDANITDMILDAQKKDLDGSIMTFVDPTRNPKWSFVKIDGNDLVTEVKEKEAISEYATVGIYYFKKGSDFINGCVDMICRNERVNNEFYVCPVYNYLIEEHKKVGIFNIEQHQMHGLGTPEDLDKYLSALKNSA